MLTLTAPAMLSGAYRQVDMLLCVCVCVRERERERERHGSVTACDAAVC